MSRSRQGLARVLIAGGGIAGLETLMALSDLAGDRVETTLIAPDPDFIYKPRIVEEPFSAQPAEQLALAPLAQEFGARFVQQGVAQVNPAAHSVQLTGGGDHNYDILVVCVGARSRPAFRDAVTFRVGGEALRIDDLLRDAERSQSREIGFVVPQGVSWSLPIYELALMSRRRARNLGLGDVKHVVVTPEEAPLILFGSNASDAVAELLRARGIEILTRTRARESETGELILAPGKRALDPVAIIALPTLEGPRIPGLPADEGGFIPIDEHARVRGIEDVYAAGDGTTFPIKQGGLGTQQADAAAEEISARLGAGIDPQPFRPVLRGQLITGEESLNLRHELASGDEGITSQDYLWWPPHKVSGRYLAAWLAGVTPQRDPEPPGRPLEVEVALPTEWHREPMALDPHAGPGGQ